MVENIVQLPCAELEKLPFGKRSIYKAVGPATPQNLFPFRQSSLETCLYLARSGSTIFVGCILFLLVWSGYLTILNAS